MASLTNLTEETDVNELWKLYKEEHNKNYDSDEDKKRFGIFKNTVKTIIEHNGKHARGEASFTMGLNKFADLHPEERFGCNKKKE